MRPGKGVGGRQGDLTPRGGPEEECKVLDVKASSKPTAQGMLFLVASGGLGSLPSMVAQILGSVPMSQPLL